MQQEK